MVRAGVRHRSVECRRGRPAMRIAPEPVGQGASRKWHFCALRGTLAAVPAIRGSAVISATCKPAACGILSSGVEMRGAVWYWRKCAWVFSASFTGGTSIVQCSLAAVFREIGETDSGRPRSVPC